MVEPKTDWKATDYFNLSDYNRITGNLTESFSLSGLSPPTFRSLVVGDVLRRDDRQRIAQAYNHLSDLYGGDPVDADKTKWFSYAELNRIETIYIRVKTEYSKGARYGSGMYLGSGTMLGGGVFG